MQPEPREPAQVASAACDLDRADPDRHADGIPRLPNGMYDMEKITDGVMRNDGTTDHAKLDALVAAREKAGSEPPAAAVSEKPLSPSEMVAKFTPPDLNVPGMDPLPSDKLPPTNVTDYMFPPFPDGDQETLRASVEARGWLQQAGVPVSLGNFVASELGNMADTSGGEDSNWEYQIASVEQKFHGLWGREVYETRKQAMGEMVKHLDRKFDGRVSAFLDANPGILLNVPLFGHLMLHAERVKGRLR